MKRQKLFFAVSSVALACAMMLSSCGGGNNSSSSSGNSENSSSSEGSDWISSDWTEIPENTNENLKYFGYFHSDGFGSLQSSYIDEIAGLGNANMAMVNSAFNVAEAVKDLTEVREAGMQAILTVHGLTRGGSTGKLDSAHLQDNYQEIWTEYQAEIQSFIDDGTIYAFYFDEPRWNGIGTEDFRTLTKYLRDTVPTVGVMACMTAMDIGIGNYGGVGECDDNYLEYCTDVMFDSYDDWNDETRRDYLDKLKAKATNDQWIWGCPKGFEAEPEVKGIQTMVDHIKGQYTEAIQDERYAGIISFSYANGTQEGDWGFGLCDFFDDQNDYYSKELKDLYTQIGCAVMGKEVPATSDLDFVVKEATATYSIGDSIALPEATATDGEGQTYTPVPAVKAPDGSDVTITDGAFKAELSGNYTVTYTVTIDDSSVKKSVEIYVKGDLELGTFDHAASINDVTGSADDIWCWPREVDLSFGRSGGSLKVTPHATDGNWPNVYFKYRGQDTVDMTKYGGISMWLYNPSDEAISGFGIKVNNGAQVNEWTKAFELPSKTWTEFRVTTAEIQAAKPALDLTKMQIAMTNTGEYTNRTAFYIDDVYLLEQTEEPATDETGLTFESPSQFASVLQDESSKWCWPAAISNEKAHSGEYSLKVTPHATDGTWSIIRFKIGEGDTFDMTDYEKVSLWVYNPSDTVINNFGLKAKDAAGKFAEKTENIAPGEWVEIVVTKDALLKEGVDITALTLEFGNFDSGYVNRTYFYVDDVKLS